MHSKGMRDLYARLRDVGFDAGFVKHHILPDWWDDDLASIPANRAIAEAAVARMLGFRIHDLRDPRAKLKLPSVSGAHLKKRKDSAFKEVAPAILVAQRAAQSIIDSMAEVPPFQGRMSAQEARKAILRDREFVDLDSLLAFAWQHGIPVLHIASLPQSSRKFDGLALFHGETPAIVLASGRDGPPWLAYQLAHEIAHILLGHVTPGEPPFADTDIDGIDEERTPEESQADRFASELLTGVPRIDVRPAYGLTAAALAGDVRKKGEEYRIDPGTLALVYGHGAHRMPAAQAALKLMGLDRGGRETIRSFFRRYFPESRLDEAHETTHRFVEMVAPAPC